MALASPGTTTVSFQTGTIPGTGTFVCEECGSHLSLREDDRLPRCQGCGSDAFRRDSIFEAMQEHAGSTLEFAASPSTAKPSWLGEARAKLPARGRYLACRDDGEIRVFPLDRGWTRIGRSAVADFRLDDPSVSRRHALVVSEPGEPLRVLDDRSLNGIFVNHESVEWGTLEDGDELTVGRYQLFALEA